jgi:hypothetical protein
MNALTNRCNSLTFAELNTLHNRMMTISESEKALLKADLEADVKYKQLISEAETILISMKSNTSLKDIAKEPKEVKEVKEVKEPLIFSPRRICNPPANKRVEMLRNCEVELKRELSKTSSQKGPENCCELNIAEGVIINKRLEVLRYETSISAPNSPKNSRAMPQKTHVTNFINQNINHCPESPKRNIDQKSVRLSPQLQLNGRKMRPPRSPVPLRRRFSKDGTGMNIESDSDSDEMNNNLDRQKGNKENIAKHRPLNNNTGKQTSNLRHAVHNGNHSSDKIDRRLDAVTVRQPPMISFRSVDMGNDHGYDSYCPQSEPLKRKIYSCSTAYDKIQKSLDIDPGE